MSRVDDDGDVAARLAGIVGPRPLPADLETELLELLDLGDPAARLAAAGTVSAPVDVPADLRDRLEAGLVAPAPGNVLPVALRRRLLRVLDAVAHDRTAVLRVAAVVVAVLVVSGGLAFAAIRDDGGRPTDLAVEPGSGGGRTGADGTGFDGLGDIGIDGGTANDGTNDLAATATSTPGATPGATPPATTPRRPARPVPPPAGDTLLVAYSSCEDLLGRTKAGALQAVGPYGVGGPSMGGPTEATADGRAASSAPAEQQSVSPSAEAASTTNVQEAGVDEPDLVKSDGRRIVTITNDTVRVSRDDGGQLKVLGSLLMPQGAFAESLLLAGDRVLVLGSQHEAQPQPEPQPSSRPSDESAIAAPNWSPPRAAIWTVDVRDPSAMRIEATLLLEGSIAAARLADGRVRIALTSTAIGPVMVYPTDNTEEAQRQALEENQRRIEQSVLDDWLPRYTLLRGTDASTARTGRLCACDDTLRPDDAFAGVSTMSVLTLDPQRPDQPPSGSAAVQGWAETVYASRSNLFVTTRKFTRTFEAGIPTAIHRFDFSAADRATYRGSGEVRGTPLNQFSLSERKDHLRVATTDASADGGSESFVTSLAIRDDRLERVGQVGNLGKGERIFAVRFLDDIGYVVTFRQTDPLYTVDLTDPTKPRVRGELKIPGFSAYLHPVESGRLLGVGQDATDTGRTTGAQISSFDVGNPDQPREVSKVGFGTNSASEVQHDHHAFLYWAPARRAMLPLQRYESTDGSYRTTMWLSVVSVSGDGVLSEVGRITHEGRPVTNGSSGVRQIRRSFVVGEVLYTLSADGILASDLQSLADRSWLPF